jgi:multiple sugar transport system substrate-binding protein
VKKLAASVAAIGTSVFLINPAFAQKTEIEVWHSLSGQHESVFESLIDRFNNESQTATVRVRDFSDQASLQKAGRDAVAGNRAKPDLVQLRDNHDPQVLAQHKDVLPLYQLLAKYPIADAAWFLNSTTAFVRDGRNRLLAFPMMAEVPVMFYNIENYRAAGLDENKPAQSWKELQAQLLTLRDQGRSRCPYASADQVNVHVENLAPLNGDLFVKPDNGLKTSRNLSLNFNTLYVRHLSLMVSWKKTDLFTSSTRGDQAERAFAQGECAVLTAGSGALATIRQGNQRFGVAPIPYYPEVTKTRGAPFITGDALWVVAGQSAARNKASAELLGFFSKPVIAAEWHQKTGFMPLTDAAFRAAEVSFYNSIPGARSIVEQMQNISKESSSGFRVPNYTEVKAILDEALDQAYAEEISALGALLGAKAAADKAMR